MPKNYRDLSITDFTCNGKCSCCGNCCGDILHLSKKEIKVIDDYLKKHKIEPTPRCVLVEYDGTCPFRDNKNKICKIYICFIIHEYMLFLYFRKKLFLNGL